MKKATKVSLVTALAVSALTPAMAIGAETNNAAPGFYNVDTGTVVSADAFVLLSNTEKVNLLKNTNVYYADGEGKVVQATKIIDSKTDAALVAALFPETELEADKNVNLTPEGTVVPGQTAELKVESVKAINATQVEVKFNSKVDEVSAETFGNYTFIDLDGQTPPATVGTAAVLQADGKTVLVTVDQALAQRYQVKTNSIFAEDGVTTVEDYNEIINFTADTKAPTIVSTDRVSSNNLKVKFSEPVTGGTITAKYADGTAISPALSLILTPGATELDVNLSNVGVTVGKDIVITLNGVADMAGNLITPQPSTVTVVKNPADGIAPVISTVTQTGAKTFKIKFNKDLNGALASSFNPSDVTTTNGGTTVGIDKISASEYEVEVTNNLDGLETVTVAMNKAVDLAGVSNAAAITKLVTFTEDTVAPTATSKLVEVNNQQYIQLTFDKNVDLVGAKTVTIAGSKVKDFVTTPVVSSDAVVKYANSNNKKIVLVPLTDAEVAIEGAEYDVTITNKATTTNGIVSEAGKAMNSLDTVFTRGEDGASINADVVTAIAVAQGATPDDVKITFTFPTGKKLDGATATNLANYSVAGATVESVSLEAASGTTQVANVKLAKNSNTFTGVRNITVKNVKVAGSTKVMTPKTINNVSVKENVKPTVTKAELTGTDKVTLTFSEAVITTANTTDFSLLIGGATVAANDQVSTPANATPGVTTVEFTLEAPVTAANLTSGLSLKALSGLGIVDFAGNKLSVPANITITQ